MTHRAPMKHGTQKGQCLGYLAPLWRVLLEITPRSLLLALWVSHEHSANQPLCDEKSSFQINLSALERMEAGGKYMHPCTSVQLSNQDPTPQNHADPGQELHVMIESNIKMESLWHSRWWQTGWSKYFRGCRSPEIFTHMNTRTHTPVSRVHAKWCEKQKTSSERQFCRQKCHVDGRMARLV